MKKSIKYVSIGACSLAAMWFSACGDTKGVAKFDADSFTPEELQRNLGAIRDRLPVEEQLFFIQNGNRSMPVNARQALSLDSDQQEVFLSRQGFSPNKSGSVSTDLKEKCFSTIPINGPGYDPRNSNYIVMGVHFAEDGTLVRTFLDPTSDRHDMGNMHNSQSFSLTDIQKQLAKIGVDNPAAFAVKGTWLNPGMPPPNINPPQGNGRTKNIRLTAPNGKTPFYNKLGKKAGKPEVKTYLFHFVMLDKNMKFTEQDAFLPISNFATVLYSPYYDYEVYRAPPNDKAKDLKVLSVWYHRGGDIGDPSRPKIGPKESCVYPYDFQLTSEFYDPKTGARSLDLITPIIVDPEGEDEGPP